MNKAQSHAPARVAPAKASAKGGKAVGKLATKSSARTTSGARNHDGAEASVPLAHRSTSVKPATSAAAAKTKKSPATAGAKAKASVAAKAPSKAAAKPAASAKPKASAPAKASDKGAATPAAVATKAKQAHSSGAKVAPEASAPASKPAHAAPAASETAKKHQVLDATPKAAALAPRAADAAAAQAPAASEASVATAAELTAETNTETNGATTTPSPLRPTLSLSNASTELDSPMASAATLTTPSSPTLFVSGTVAVAAEGQAPTESTPARPQATQAAAAGGDAPGRTVRDDPSLDRRIIEGMLDDKDGFLDVMHRQGFGRDAVVRRAAELGLSEALIRQVKGVAADLAGERPGRRPTPGALGARTCLSCDRVFFSSGPGNRLCTRCRGGDAGLAQL